MTRHADAELLDCWRRSRDRAAMDELVRRNIHFVYGTACRIMRDRNSAEDVTQAVFMLLIQKSPRINHDCALASWLHRTTRFAASNARRMSARRVARDQRVSKMEAMHSTSADQIDERDEQAALLPILDEAIGSLGTSDREAILLSYFQQRSFQEVGDAIGVSEGAARKRISRAIERLREHFRSRGLTTTSTALSGCLAQQTLRASSALLESTLRIAPAINLTTQCTASAQIAQKVMHTMLMFKMKLAAAACVAVIAGAALTATAIHSARAESNRAAAPDESEFAVKVDDKVEVSLLGVAKSDADARGWLTLAGQKIDNIPGRLPQESLDIKEDSHKLLFHVASTEELPSIFFDAPHANHPHLFDLNDGPNAMEYMIYFNADAKNPSPQVTILVADGEWKQICDAKIEPTAPVSAFESKDGNFVFTPVMKSPRGAARVYVSHPPIEGAWRVCAIDTQGQSHECGYNIQDQAGNICTDVMDFGIAPKEVVSFSVEARKYNHRIVIKNLALDAEHPGKPTITVEDIK